MISRPKASVLLILCVGAVCAAASGGQNENVHGLTVKVKHKGGSRVIEVDTADYTATLQPEEGGALTSLRRGGTEMVPWKPGSRGGMFREAETAGLEFDVQESEEKDERVTVRMSAARGEVRCVKTFIFPAHGASFRVRLSIENRTPHPLTGPDRPRFYAFMSPAGKEASGVERILLDAGRGARSMGPGVFARRYSSPAAPDGTIRWLGAADVASRRGMAIVFRDAGALSLRAARCGPGTGVSWTTKGVPAGSVFRAEARVMMWSGIGALTSVTDDVLSRASVQDGDTPSVKLTMRAVDEPLEQVTVISRLYGTDGKDVGVGQSLAFGTVTPDEAVTASAELPGAQGRVGWILQEVRSKGEVVERHVVPLGGPAGACPLDDMSLPAPQIESLETDGPNGPWTAWRAAGSDRAEPERVSLYMAADEAETVFFGLRALQKVEKVSARLAGPQKEDASRLPGGAAALWRVKGAADPDMTPFKPTGISEGETLWLALRVQSAGVKPGTWRRRLVLEGADKTLTIPLRVTVAETPLPENPGFGLWLSPDGRGDLQADERTFSRLAGQRVSVMTWPLEGQADADEVGRMTELAADAGLDGIGFQSSAPEGPSPGGVAGTRPREVLLPLERPVWLLRSSPVWFSSPAKAAEAGFSAGGVVEALPPCGGRNVSGLEHVLVRGGATGENVSSMVDDGALSGDARVWVWMPVSGASWARAARRLRSACWAAAWQRMAGLAVDARPAAGEGARNALLEVSRDAAEEAHLWRRCRVLADVLRDVKLEEEERQKERAILMEDLRAVLGRGRDCRLRVRADRTGLSPVMRAFRPDSDRLPPVRYFRQAKGEVLGLMERICRLLPEHRRRLYWRRRAVVAGGRPRALIVVDGSDAAAEAAVAIRREIVQRTGQKVEIASTFPSSGAVKGREINVVWVVGTAERVDGLPKALADRAAAAQGAWTAPRGDARVVGIPGGDVGTGRIIGGFHVSERFYPPARAVR